MPPLNMIIAVAIIAACGAMLHQGGEKKITVHDGPGTSKFITVHDSR